MAEAGLTTAHQDYWQEGLMTTIHPEDGAGMKWQAQ